MTLQAWEGFKSTSSLLLGARDSCLASLHLSWKLDDLKELVHRVPRSF